MRDNDAEKRSLRSTKAGSPIPDYSSGFGNDPSCYEETTIMRPRFANRVLDGFRRDPNLHVTTTGVLGVNGRVFDPDAAAEGTANTKLSRRLKGRHLQMIAIGGSIGMSFQLGTGKLCTDCFISGTGLFVASGGALAQGGPATLLICYSLIGCMLYCTVHALGEMAVLFPVSGSFSAYSTRFLDPAWGFAMGWK